MKRANHRGTLYRRQPGCVWYTKIMIAGKWVRHSTGTSDRDAAEKVLNQYAVGSDLPEVARLAAVKALIEEKRAPSATFEDAWTIYCRHPKNANQSDGAREVDGGRYRALTAKISSRIIFWSASACCRRSSFRWRNYSISAILKKIKKPPCAVYRYCAKLWASKEKARRLT